MKTQDTLWQQTAEAHKQRFKTDPEAMCFSPAAVEILGNHTDYNQGLALSCAMDRGVCLAFSLADSGEAIIQAADLQEEESFDPENFRPAAGRPWAVALKGLLKLLLRQMKSCPSFRLTYCSRVAIETGHSGLSPLEAAAALLIRRFLSLDISRQDLVKTCQKVEQDFLENACGPLDFFTSLFAANHALLLTDFQNLTSKPVVPSSRYAFFLCGTGPKRATWKEEYKKRRDQCAAATAEFEKGLQRKLNGLRDVTMSEWMDRRASMDPVVANRAAHVIGENERARRGADFIREGRFEDLGLLMYTSHESSLRNMENSSPEIDYIVEQARAVEGILGARLSGVGFGGSALVLAAADNAPAAAEELGRRYAVRFGAPPTIQFIVPSSCAGLRRGLVRN